MKSYTHFQLIVVGILIFATFGTALAVAEYDKFNLDLHKDTKGYSPNFLNQIEVRMNCQLALADGWLLGYCSKELGTL